MFENWKDEYSIISNKLHSDEFEQLVRFYRKVDEIQSCQKACQNYRSQLEAQGKNARGYNDNMTSTLERSLYQTAMETLELDVKLVINKLNEMVDS